MHIAADAVSLTEWKQRIRAAIEHATHLLPAQGPITTFVHHNTLHAFEDLPFEEALERAAETYHCHPYLREERYRQELDAGRIQLDDLAAVLRHDLADNAHARIGALTTRYDLRLAMLKHPLRVGTPAELHWLFEEAEALRAFQPETPPNTQDALIRSAHTWLDACDTETNAIAASIRKRFGKRLKDRSDNAVWRAPTLEILWRMCSRGVEDVAHRPPPEATTMRHVEALRAATNEDADRLVNDMLIRFCAAFLDQGFARWRLPDRDAGFWTSFISLYQHARFVDSWLVGLPKELQRIDYAKLSPIESICESLDMLAVRESEMQAYIDQTLLALRGWSGMIWQMESNAEWTLHPAPSGSLKAYLAVRLILERVAMTHIVQHSGIRTTLRELRSDCTRDTQIAHPPEDSHRAFHLFQLSQWLGWGPDKLSRCTADDWTSLVHEIEQFSSRERRRVFHLAYERRYRNQSLNAVASHVRSRSSKDPLAPKDGAEPQHAYQVVCCIDEREESFRRHLEEIDPDCDTYGFAGFYGVAMYYRGATEAHFHPLCPVVVKPQHYVQEEPLFSFEETSRLQADTRRRIGQAAHRVHLGSRSFVGGLLTGLLGALATIPLVMRILFPRLSARVMRMFGNIVTPAATQLRVERIDDVPGPTNGQIGYSLGEMTTIVGNVLRSMGLTHHFAPIVIFVGHGSSSMNNPHEAAHDCGACGGGRGGPNARAFAQMANDPRVRNRLAKTGLNIPDDVHFVGSYHNTCDDSMTYYDLDRVPVGRRAAFVRARNALQEARQRNAHERCRRFESAGSSYSTEAALRHVEGRSEDLSQVRPEYGHATNALCFVGRREWSQGLFLDRRAFLTSYDSRQDDEDRTILEGLLRAVIPVCAGINLEYYFSYVDATGYGCGTKLPHNITSLLGVMDGASSDLRPGLPWQMVEIHDPVRILFVIETTPTAMTRIMDNNPAIAQLVRNRWVQLATLNPDDGAIQLFEDGEFVPFEDSNAALPTAESSAAWYQGKEGHLPFASIVGSESSGHGATTRRER